MYGSGAVSCSCSLLIRGPNLARCRAEAPLIALCRFPKPALNSHQCRRDQRTNRCDLCQHGDPLAATLAMVSNENLIDAARVLSALVRKFGLIKRPESQQVPATIDVLDLYYNLVKDEELRKQTERRFINGHYQDAVLEAFKYLNNCVKLRVRPTTGDGAGLMKTAFSAGRPILKLNSFMT